jgi:heme/copper-type cytochrome/quinol oxidase subunit 4
MNSFSLLVGIGAGIGLWRVVRGAPERQATFLLNTGLIILGSGLVGARLAYVWINWAYFATHLPEILQIWLGGLSWPGAFAGAALALSIIAIPARTPRGDAIPAGWFGDRLYPMLPPLAISLWLGCWQTGHGYGPLLPGGTWWGVPSLDETGTLALHWPLQPLAAVTLLAFFGILETLIPLRRPVGRLSGLALTGLLLHLLAFSFASAEPGPTWQGLRLETWAAILFLALIILAWLVGRLFPRAWRDRVFSRLVSSHQ